MQSAVVVLALASIAFPGFVRSEILAVCGASQGRGYYLRGPFIKREDAGWQEDAITSGSFQLIRSGDDFDIIFTDATGGTMSAKGDGGKILGFVNENGDVVVTVFYPKAIETYVFWFSARGELVATFSQAKHAAPITKHALFKANCRRLQSGDRQSKAKTAR